MNWIQTYTGKQFFPLDPDPGVIDIHDIAHALSLQCRFNGHCRTFYSVAEHSVRVSEIVPAELARWGLLHDAAEAYLTDLPRPIKRQMPTFEEIEKKLLHIIAEHFELSWPMPAEVARVDTELLAAEARDLMAPPPASWRLGVEAAAVCVEPWSWQEAEREFLRRFEQLQQTHRA